MNHIALPVLLLLGSLAPASIASATSSLAPPTIQGTIGREGLSPAEVEQAVAAAEGSSLDEIWSMALELTSRAGSNPAPLRTDIDALLQDGSLSDSATLFLCSTRLGLGAARIGLLAGKLSALVQGEREEIVQEIGRAHV